MDKWDYLIVGAGFAGSVCAERLASAGKTVLLIDQRSHIGGNAYDCYDDAGILVQPYGPHIFHTNSDDVFAYLSRFTEWWAYEHRVLANVDGRLLPVPINTHTLAAFGGDVERAKAAIYVPYTRKQWGCDAGDLDPSVLARVAVRDSYDDRYFLDRHQAMPMRGYTRLFEKMLDHPNISVKLNTPFEDVLPSTDTIWTGPIDQFFDYCYGELPYRSATFQRETIHAGSYQAAAVVNHPSEAVPYTRVTEFKKLTGQRHPWTTVAFEYPSVSGDPYWPIPKPANAALYQQYKTLAEKRTDVHFCGRLGTYAYINMDAAVAQALKLTKSLLTKEQTHADRLTA